jgi:hypothetical protein
MPSSHRHRQQQSIGHLRLFAVPKRLNLKLVAFAVLADDFLRLRLSNQSSKLRIRQFPKSPQFGLD